MHIVTATNGDIKISKPQLVWLQHCCGFEMAGGSVHSPRRFADHLYDKRTPHQADIIETMTYCAMMMM